MNFFFTLSVVNTANFFLPCTIRKLPDQSTGISVIKTIFSEVPSSNRKRSTLNLIGVRIYIKISTNKARIPCHNYSNDFNYPWISMFVLKRQLLIPISAVKWSLKFSLVVSILCCLFLSIV